MTFKPTYWTQLTRSINNMTGNCLFDPFVLKYIHIYIYFVKKRDFYKIFRLQMMVSWEPGSQVPRHYPTLTTTKTHGKGGRGERGTQEVQRTSSMDPRSFQAMLSIL